MSARRRTLNRSAVLEIERELRRIVRWINGRPKPLRDYQETALYAYQQSMQIVRRHYLMLLRRDRRRRKP